LYQACVGNDRFTITINAPMTPTDDTRQRLIEAAGPLFAEKGQKATTVRDVVDRARLNVAAVNYHFGDKDALYLCCVRAASEHCMEVVPLPTWEPGTPPARKLRDFIEMFLQRVAVDREPAWHAQLIMRELVLPTPACAEFAREFARPNYELLLGVLRELLPPEVPGEKVRLCAFSIIGQCLHHRVGRPIIRTLLTEEELRGLDVAHVGEHIYDFSLAALRGLAAKYRKGAGAARVR
jgi:AcrR family transcriptional regulator